MLQSTFILLVILFATFDSAIAGPPFVTDDPEPVEFQHWEVNYGITKTWSDGASSAGLPSIDINYGFAPDIQLHAQPRYSFVRDSGIRNDGVDNTEVGVKYRFINNQYTDSTWMVGVYPMIQLPTGDSKLSSGSGKTQIFLPIWTQFNQQNWTLYGGAGYRINNWTDSKNSLFVGGTALYQLTNTLALGGEIFRETATMIGEQSTSGFNLGGIYKLTEDYHLLFSAGKGLSNVPATNTLSVYMALQVIY